MTHVLGLWEMLGQRQRRRFWLALFLMLAGAASELITIGLVVPFLHLLSGTEPRWNAIADLPISLVVTLLVTAGFASAAIRLALTGQSQRFALEVGHALASRIFSRMLRGPYAEHVRRNSSEILAGFENVQVVTSGIVLPVMQGFIAAFIGAAVIVFLFVLDPLTAVLATFFVVGIYVGSNLTMRHRLRQNSAIVATAGRARIKMVQEAIGGFRDIVLDSSQPIFEERFRLLDARYREAQSSTLLVAAAPRFVVEAAAIAALTLVALSFVSDEAGLAAAIPMLGILAVAGQRLLPLFQKAYGGWSRAAGNLQPLADVIALATKPMPVDEVDANARPIIFEREIAFESVSYHHDQTGFGVCNVNLSIRKAQRIGITGPSGSGKSTLLDLLMGLLEPAAGTILIDGNPLDTTNRKSWRQQIAHVPQSVYLLDDTIMANIAFGIPFDSVSEEQVRAAAAAAQIEGFIEQLPSGYYTVVGERGVRLSGGQRQRLGIARALYKQAPILVLDEATSSCDEATEARLLDSIYASDATIIIVAHRNSTLRKCDEVLRLDDGRILHAAPSERPAAKLSS